KVCKAVVPKLRPAGRIRPASTFGPAGKPSPAELKQKDSRQFKTSSQRSFRGLDDAAVICPWEEFGDVELSDLAQFGTA
uniref:3',5'-cyclic-GMP phosphodiesterase n=1 Tax=Poecilia mexicana TaxID=48701 RepID=A0A3B3XHX2_9TELE